MTATEHINAAKPILKLVTIITGILAGLAIIGGIVGIIWNAYSPTMMELFGAKVSTGHVGVAFTALGLIIIYFVFKKVLKSTYDLAALEKETDG